MPKGAKYEPKYKDELRAFLKNGIECRDIDFSLINSLSYLFRNNEDILLQNNVYFIDLENPDELIWNTENVTEMYSMFEGCSNFNKPIRLDTRKVKRMEEMFKDCKNFDQEINFDCSSAISMGNMFRGCRSLNKPIRLKNIGRKNWKKFNEGFYIYVGFPYVFDGCDSLKEWNLIYLDFDEHIKFTKRLFEDVYKNLSGRDFKIFLSQIKRKYKNIMKNEKIQKFLSI